MINKPLVEKMIENKYNIFLTLDVSIDCIFVVLLIRNYVNYQTHPTIHTQVRNECRLEHFPVECVHVM